MSVKSVFHGRYLGFKDVFCLSILFVGGTYLLVNCFYTPFNHSYKCLQKNKHTFHFIDHYRTFVSVQWGANNLISGKHSVESKTTVRFGSFVLYIQEHPGANLR